MIRFTLIVWAVLCIGCAKAMPDNVADVSGMVTVDGKPAPGAMVSFSPEGEGRTSFGLTDDTGHYQLVYTNEIPGALVGAHNVSINNTPPPGKPRPSVLIPAKFTQAGKLTAKVVAGENNEINFDLKSK